MKILSVRLKNINSLKGEHFIAFNQSPFTDSGLFAITGPTGAGKSSILDAITLALYGWAPRFNRESPFEIMSYHTSDCLAEVEFSVKDNVYRSKWSLHRSRGKVDGEIQHPKMELVDVEANTILESKKTEVITKVTEITGLDYFRFLRSVMLAQGDFAAFLKADEKTRGELLEKITGTAIYTQLSKKAFEKQKEKKQILEQLENQLDTSRLLDAQQIDQHLQQIATNKEKIYSLTTELQHLSLQMQWLETMEKLRKKAIHLKLELEQVQGLKHVHQADFDRYQKHQQTFSLQPLHREIEVLESGSQQMQWELEQIESAIPVLTLHKEEKAALVRASHQKLIEAKKAWESMLPLFEQTAEVDKDLLTLQEQYKKKKAELIQVTAEQTSLQQQADACQSTLTEYSQKQNQILDYLHIHRQDACLETELGVIEQNIALLNGFNKELSGKEKEDKLLLTEENNFAKEIKVLEEEVKQHTTSVKWKQSQIRDIEAAIKQLLGDAEAETIEQQILQLSKQYLYRQNQLTTAKEYIEKNDKLLFLQQEIPLNEKFVIEQQDRLHVLKEKEQQTFMNVELLQKLYESEQLILNYEKARQELVPGETCPLCGSLHHPFVKEHHAIEINKTVQQRDSQKKVLEQLRRDIEITTRELSITEANQITFLKDVKNLSLEVTNLEKIFAGLNAHLGEHNSITNLQVLTQKLADNTSGQQNLQNLLKVYKEKSKIQTQYKEQYDALGQTLQALDKKLSEQRLMLTHTQNNLQKLKQDVTSIQEKKDRQQQALQHILAAYEVELPIDQQDQSWLTYLRKRSATYQQSVQNEKELTRQIQGIQLELEKISGLLIKTNQQAEKQQEELAYLELHGKILREKRRELFGDKNIAEEKEQLTSLLSKYEWQLKQNEKELNNYQEQLSIKNQQLSDKQLLLTRNSQKLAIQQKDFDYQLLREGFACLSDFKTAILDKATEASIKHQKELIEEKINGSKGAIAQNEIELKEQGAKELTEAGMEELQQARDILENEKEGLIAQTARLEQIILENEELSEKHKSLTGDVEKCRSDYNKWKILAHMIGSATGAEFNVFAQGLTLARLVFLANRYLHKLNPRYQIRRKPHTDLDLEIIDRYQADNVRSIKTLSGGETFLVSLSLALGLSDLAGNKTRIDSLFIDEGFGTLDPQALDIAITTLENLQATGKMIGIISHVDALKERITTQVQVTKQASGVSKIEIIA